MLRGVLYRSCTVLVHHLRQTCQLLLRQCLFHRKGWSGCLVNSRPRTTSGRALDGGGGTVHITTHEVLSVTLLHTHTPHTHTPQCHKDHQQPPTAVPPKTDAHLRPPPREDDDSARSLEPPPRPPLPPSDPPAPAAAAAPPALAPSSSTSIAPTESLAATVPPPAAAVFFLFRIFGRRCWPEESQETSGDTPRRARAGRRAGRGRAAATFSFHVKVLI